MKLLNNQCRVRRFQPGRLRVQSCGRAYQVTRVSSACAYRHVTVPKDTSVLWRYDNNQIPRMASTAFMPIGAPAMGRAASYQVSGDSEKPPIHPAYGETPIGASAEHRSGQRPGHLCPRICEIPGNTLRLDETERVGTPTWNGSCRSEVPIAGSGTLHSAFNSDIHNTATAGPGH